MVFLLAAQKSPNIFNFFLECSDWSPAALQLGYADVLWNQVALHFERILSLFLAMWSHFRAWAFVSSLKQFTGRRKGKVWPPFTRLFKGCANISLLHFLPDWEVQGGCPHTVGFLFCMYNLPCFSFPLNLQQWTCEPCWRDALPWDLWGI